MGRLPRQDHRLSGQGQYKGRRYDGTHVIISKKKTLFLDSNNSNKLKENELSISPVKEKSNSLYFLPEKDNKLKNESGKIISHHNNNLAHINNIHYDNEKKNNKINSKNKLTKNPGGPSFKFKTIIDKQTYYNEVSNDSQFAPDDDILEYIPFKLFPNLLVLITETYSQQIENDDLNKQVNKLNDIVKRIIEKSPNEIKNYGFVPVEITNIILIGMKNTINNNKS